MELPQLNQINFDSLDLGRVLSDLPQALRNLLKDNRYPSMQRYLREIYLDPIPRH